MQEYKFSFLFFFTFLKKTQIKKIKKSEIGLEKGWKNIKSVKE